MRFTFPAGLKRSPAAVDFSDVTDAKLDGDPEWVDEHTVEIPFSRPLSSAEVQAISLRLSTTSPAQESLMKAISAYLSTPSPSQTQTNALIREFAIFYAGGSQ